MPQSDLSAIAALTAEMQVLRAQVASLVTAGINPPPPPPAPSAAIPAASAVIAAPTVAAPPAVITPPAVNPPSAAGADPLMGSIAANATGELAGKFLGGTIQEDLRKIIREGAYLDFPLLKKETYESKKNGLGQTTMNQPETFLDWLDLFNIFASIRLQHYPSEGPHLAAYLQIIKNLSCKEGGKVWRDYDRDFRKSKVSDKTLPWYDLNFRLLWPLLPPREVAAPAKNPNPSNQPFRSATGGPLPSNACGDFYYQGWCPTIKECKLAHMCGHCHNSRHSLKRCPRFDNSKSSKNSRKSHPHSNSNSNSNSKSNPNTSQSK
jgi:hypothetical protein